MSVTKNAEVNKGKTAIQDSSGALGVAVGVEIGDGASSGLIENWAVACQSGL